MVTLQKAAFSDYESIARLHAANWRDNYRGILSENFLDKEVDRYMLKTWRKKLHEPPAKQYTSIAYRDKKIAGFSCLVTDDDPLFGSMLDNLHVAAEARYQGIGKLLMQHCASLILAHATTPKMYLWVYVQNKSAVAVYESWGGRQHETLQKSTAEGSGALVHRYTWDDVSILC